jgi:hypothetical protein
MHVRSLAQVLLFIMDTYVVSAPPFTQTGFVQVDEDSFAAAVRKLCIKYDRADMKEIGPTRVQITAPPVIRDGIRRFIKGNPNLHHQKEKSRLR